jgi:hypothetical protein
MLAGRVGDGGERRDRRLRGGWSSRTDGCHSRMRHCRRVIGWIDAEGIEVLADQIERIATL